MGKEKREKDKKFKGRINIKRNFNISANSIKIVGRSYIEDDINLISGGFQA